MVNKKLQAEVKKATASDFDAAPVITKSTEDVETALEAIPHGTKHPETPGKFVTPKKPTTENTPQTVTPNNEGYVSAQEEETPAQKKTPTPMTPAIPAPTSTIKSATAELLSTAVSPGVARAVSKRAPITTPKSPDDPVERMEQGLQPRKSKSQTPRSTPKPRKKKGMVEAIGDVIGNLFGGAPKAKEEPILPITRPTKASPRRTPKKGLNLTFKTPEQPTAAKQPSPQPAQQPDKVLNEGVTRHVSAKTGQVIFRKGGKITSAANAYKST
jgi:hypothetical protein